MPTANDDTHGTTSNNNGKPATPQSLLEPSAPKRRTLGSEGAQAQQCAWATRQGWLYLATVIDCCSREVIGWATGDNYKTPLIEAAIEMAARNHDLAPGAIFHSDRGSNYMSTHYRETLEGLDIRQSVGRTGICYDNALAESFFGVLKTELTNRTVYPTRKHAERDIASYIELRYNARRLHSGLGYRTPREVRDEYLKAS